MQPNFRRLLPFILIAVFLFVLLPGLLKKGRSGPSAGTLSQQTIAATNLVDRAELRYRAAHHRYSGHLADLLVLSDKLGADLADGVAVQLDVGGDGQSYFAEVGSSVISLVRAREGGNTITRGCRVVKSGSGVKCPVAAATAAAG